MALVTFNHGIESVRGRMGNGNGGVVYYQSQGRAICRSLPTARAPSTEAQRLGRGICRELSRRFSQFDRPRVEAWNAFAANFARCGNSPDRNCCLSGLQAYQSVNTHRMMSGGDPLINPPPCQFIPAVDRAMGAVIEGDGRLRLVLEHVIAEGSGFLRIRLTPPLATPARRAYVNQLRHATDDPAKSYIAITGSPQTVILSPRWKYSQGQTLGVEALSLSRDYVPGGVLFVPWIDVG